MKEGVIGILGLGAMGQIIAKDLHDSFKGKVVYLVRNPSSIKEIAKKYRAEVRIVDISKPESLVKAFKGIDVIIHAVHHEFNVRVMEACLEANCHYVDLGGLFHFTREQLKLNEEFKRKRLTAVIGMGASPGITNVLAKYGAQGLEKVEAVQIRIGMKDFSKYKRVSPLSASYSLQTLLEEFSWKPAVWKNGKMVFVEPLSGREPYVFPKPIGKQKPQYTIHSELATLPFTLRAKNVSFKIAFDDDFVEKVMLLKRLGLTKDEEIEIKHNKINIKSFLVEVLKQLPKSIPKKIEQYEIIRVVVKGIKEKKSKTIILDTKIHSVNETIDKETGVPPSIVAQFILSNQIKERGVFPPELIIPAESFFKELTKRKIFIFQNNKRIN
ncbi:MAG: saccharopine dehydrogenase C-terminal domain-containing protein [Candidatus Nanoarchaeia archaeon]